jgi:uncharacterized protein
MQRGSQLRPWLLVAIAAAERRALGEARYQWGLRGGATPFNYRLEHLRAVVAIANELAAKSGADAEVCLAGAWLHDVAKAYHEERGDGHGQRGAVRAAAILRGTDFPREKIAAVGVAIAAHVGLFRDELPEPIEAAVLFEADKISKLGATSIVHFLCSYPASARVAGRPADTTNVAQELRRWVDLAPRIVDSLSTPAGREIGEQRLVFLRAFVDQLEGEISALVSF